MTGSSTQADRDPDELDQPTDPTDPDSPWHGIPAELLDGSYSHALDSAGGCG